MDGVPRFLRRARGYAPAPLPLPVGFTGLPPILSLGGELKNTFCLLEHGHAVLSQHLGDLEDARTFAEYERTVALYLRLYAHRPERLVVDAHPEYRATRFGRAWAKRDGLLLEVVQHHHAHVASVLAENGWPADGGRVLGVALDGLGYGSDGTLWGGEFLAADYAGFVRLAHLAPAAMPGGMRAILEPWRNTVAQLAAHLGWAAFRRDWGDLPLARELARQPTEALLGMIARGFNSPPSSSCGRLFDAVAAAAGLCADRVSYEGEAAVALEAALEDDWASVASPYPFRVETDAIPWRLSPAPLWPALLADLRADAPASRLAARFHAGLALAVTDLAARLARAQQLDTVALSGGVFQNRALYERVASLLRERGLAVLGHRLVPANDGGLSLGQAAIAAMRIRIAGSAGV
jgi:hydrogenase maturation protein HypF